MTRANDTHVGETRPYNGAHKGAHKPAVEAIEICNRCGNVLTSSTQKLEHNCIQPPKGGTISKVRRSASRFDTQSGTNQNQTVSKLNSFDGITKKSRTLIVLFFFVTVATIGYLSRPSTSFSVPEKQSTPATKSIVSSKGLASTESHLKKRASLLAASEKPALSAESVKGQWQVSVESGNEQFQGVMQLLPQGNALIGNGSDELGTFTLKGEFIQPNKIIFTKKYDAESCRRGAHPLEINFGGTITSHTASALTCDGFYHTQVKFGFAHSYYRKSQWRPVQQRWSARKVSDVVDRTIASAGTAFTPWNPLKALDAQPVPPQPKPAGAQSNFSTNDGAGIAQQFFLLLAGAAALVGMVIFFLTSKLFGIDGLSSRSEVARYIPKQFQKDHNRMLNQFGKPVEAGGVPIGTRADWRWWKFWKPKHLSIPLDVRNNNPHMLIVGTSGKGKTRLVASMVAHDIESADRAVVIIDSSGELTDLVSAWMKTKKTSFAKRLILINPSELNSSPSYNPLELASDGDLQAAASAIVHGFKAIYTESPGKPSKWNQQTANILRNSALLLMRNQRTLADLPALLQDNDFRDLMLETIELQKEKRAEDITLIETWNQYKRLARSEQWIDWVEPLLNQISPMLSDRRIRSIVSKPVSELSLKQVILDKKILLVRVSKSELGQNANLLGSLILTGLQQAALELNKDKKAPPDRKVALYLDEMDNFVDKETITNLCAETARYQIGFVALLKTLQYIPEDFRHKLLISVGTIAAFSLVRKDGELLGPQMFRVDGRKFRHQTIDYFTNRMVIPQPDKAYHLISDEEKLNIDRVVAQDSQHFFCYCVGTTAGVFKMRAHNFEL